LHCRTALAMHLAMIFSIILAMLERGDIGQYIFACKGSRLPGFAIRTELACFLRVG
jgi:hypothetical protein